MQVVFSPCLPPDTCLFVVTQSGLQGVNNSKVIQGHQDREGHTDKQLMQQPSSEQQSVLQIQGNDTMPQYDSHTLPQQRTLATGVFAAQC